MDKHSVGPRCHAALFSRRAKQLPISNEFSDGGMMMRQLGKLLKSCHMTAIAWMLLFAVMSVTARAEEAKPLREPVASDDFVIREEMIPMRNGVKLYTIIMFAPIEAYKAQQHRIHHDKRNATYIEFRTDPDR